MKKSILLGASLALVSLALAPAYAQTTTTSGYIQSSTVLGSTIKDSQGQDIGEIKDFVLDRNTGCLAYVVVSTKGGGTTTTTSKTVAAPWSVFASTSQPRVYTTTIQREKIYSAPVWESTRIEEYSRTNYITNVYGYYGVTAPRINAEVNLSTTTNPTTTTTTNSSVPTVAPSASLSPPGNPNASATPVPYASSTPAPNASVKPLPTAPATTAPKTAPSVSATPPKEMSGTSQMKAEQDAAAREKSKADEPTSKKSDKKATTTETKKEKTETPNDSTTTKSTTKKSTKKSTEPDASATPKE
jgi:sporulation protein YlmC with PRC-barrel domain